MRIVMTGATSGIGLAAARALIARPDVQLTIGARDPGGLPAELRGRVRVEPLDLGTLESVRAFADAVAAQGPIDRLILNAGGQQVGRAVSSDGFERTFAVNHLAHHLLARALAPGLARDGRVILTASGTHDPAQKTGMPPPLHADAERLAYPERDPDRDADDAKAGRRAYSTSKLLNVMTVRELARRMADSRPDLMVAAFDPGFTPGTGLARDYGRFVNMLFRTILPIVIRGDRVSTPVRSGGLLAELATAPRYASSRGTYWAYQKRRLVDEAPSALARDGAACRTLWEDSARLADMAEG